MEPNHPPKSLSPTRILFTLTALLFICLLPARLAAQTAGEIADLQYMREEEKLARDLYTAFYDLWKNDIFSNIATSEQRHMDAVLSLLNLYGISDPAAGQPAGQFTDNTLQDRYDDLYSQGSASLSAALSAGIDVEETDIADLDAAIAGTTNAAILRVFSNLRKGSENHLAAFSNRLEQVDSSANTGNSFGPGDGTAVFEPLSQSLFIPAIDVTSKTGNVVVFDAMLRIVETLPVTLELLTASATDKLPNAQHASYNAANGVLTINNLSIGSLFLDSLNDTAYTAVFHLAREAGGAFFVLDSLTPL